MSEVHAAIRRVFAEAGATGTLHVRDLGGSGGEVAYGADDPVVLASVFKVVVAVAFEREIAAGRIHPAERATVTSRYRTGGVGTSGLHHDAELSLHDLSHLMLTLSDNAATDVLYHRIGATAVNRVLSDLGLGSTRVLGCCEDILVSIAAELDLPWPSADLDAELGRVAPDRLRQLAVLDPQRTSASTARDMTLLLEAIWSDRATTAEGCERIRHSMTQQIWPHRLTAGFAGKARVAGKTGTLPGIRNEVGVVSYPDGGRFAVAVFTTSQSLGLHLPDVDRALGRAACLAVEHLRGLSSAPGLAS